jgi:hypothetical protein
MWEVKSISYHVSGLTSPSEPSSVVSAVGALFQVTVSFCYKNYLQIEKAIKAEKEKK